jgi:hypothetical protein
MLKTMTLATSLALAGTAPAAAGSWGWGIGVGFGPPIYWEPPAVYVPAPPPGYYGEAPAIVAPVEPPAAYGRVDPGAVIDALAAAGYTEIGRIRQRGGLYRLTAVDPDGNRLALDISVHSGEIERAQLLEARYEEPPVGVPVQPPARRAPPPQASAAPGAPTTMHDRLQAQAAAPDAPPPTDQDRDPLVVY